MLCDLRAPSRLRGPAPHPPLPPPAAAATGRASGGGAHEYHTESLGFTESPPPKSDSINPADSLSYPSSPTSTSPATSRGNNRSRVRWRRPRISHRITGIYRISATQVGFDQSGRFAVLSFFSHLHLPRHQPRQQQVARPAEAPTNITPNHWDLPNLRHPSRIRSIRQIRCSILLLPPPPPPPPAAATTGRASGGGAHEYHTESLGFTESPPPKSDSINPADSLSYPSSPTSTSPATSRGNNRSRVRWRRPRISHRITGIYRISATQVGFDQSGRFAVLSFFSHLHLPRHQPRQQQVARPAEDCILIGQNLHHAK